MQLMLTLYQLGQGHPCQRSWLPQCLLMTPTKSPNPEGFLCDKKSHKSDDC